MKARILHTFGCRPSTSHNRGLLAKTSKPAVTAVMAFVAVLACSAVSARAETIRGTGIGTFPYTITKCGLYHLTANNHLLNCTNGAAITIQLSAAHKNFDVVLDLNDHTILQTNRHYSTSSSVNYPTGIRIVTTGTGRVTVRNGTLGGFGVGIEVKGGDQFLIENMTIVGSSRDGIWISGSSKNGTIRNNRIIGSTDTVRGYSIQCGIYTSGSPAGMKIVSNDIGDLWGGFWDAVGIYGSGSNWSVENNHVYNIQCDGGNGSCYGILVGGTGTTVINNRVNGVDYGIYLYGGGHYRDNIVDQADIPYLDGTNAGNNH